MTPTQYPFKRVPAVGEAVDPDDLEALSAGVSISVYTLTLGETVIPTGTPSILGTIPMPAAIVGMSVEADFNISEDYQRIELDLKGSVKQSGLTNSMILICGIGDSGTVYNPGGCAATGVIEAGDTALVIGAISGTGLAVTVNSITIKIYYVA
jgi:hypothetical protein